MDRERKQKTCCFTGHRIISKKEKQYLSNDLKEILRQKIGEGCCNFAAGGAIGFDTLAAQTVLELREDYPHIRLELILPFKGQEKRWRADQQELYHRILEQADSVDFLCEDYMSLAYHARNRALVERSSCCICFLRSGNNPRSGTKQTVQMAREQGHSIINLYQD